MFVRLFVLPILVVLAFAVAQPSAAAEFSPQQKQEIGETVRDYLLKNPEVIIEVMRELEKRRTVETERKQKTALATLDTVLASPMSPTGGNADGDVTIVEFFDYQCSYCKRVFPHLRKIMADDGKVRFAMKEFPVLGPTSVFAARAALAVWKLEPKKYMDFHTRLMDLKGRLSENKVIVTATEMGLNEQTLRKTMLSSDVEKELNATETIARDLGLTGTPAFIIGGQVFPGYMELDQLQKVIAHIRAQKKK